MRKRIEITVLCDTRLSYRARGIFFYFLSKPNGWKGHIYDLKNNSAKDGATKIRTAINELVNFGYIELTREKSKCGKFDGCYYKIKQCNGFVDIPYKEQYNHPIWKQLREKIIKRDKFQCRQCGSKNKVLHVHHKSYNFDSGYIWDVPTSELITLCEECHNKIHGNKFNS